MLVLLVNLSIEKKLNIPILQGKYKEFSVEWYRLVGASLIIQMTVMILTSQATNIATELYCWAKRVYDRCRWNKRDKKGKEGEKKNEEGNKKDTCCCELFSTSYRNTRKLTQHDYENLYLGNEARMEFRYANMMTVTFVVMMYGSGMPILYIVAALFYFVAYWVDKTIFFKCYQTPDTRDMTMINGTIDMFFFAVALHLIGGVLMYSNSNILPVDFGAQYYNEMKEYTAYYSFGNVNSQQMIIYICFFTVVIVSYVIWRYFYDALIWLYQMCRSKEHILSSLVQDENYTADFYDQVDYKELVHIMEQN